MLLKTWQWFQGMLYVVAVAVIWIIASFVVQSVVDAGVSPLLISYVCNTLFLVYIPIVELGNLAKSALAQRRSKHIDVDTSVDADTPPTDPLEIVRGSETEKLLEGGSLSDQGSQPLATSKEDTCLINETSVKLEKEAIPTATSSPKAWSRKKIAAASLIVCPFWFLAQYTFNLSLKYTTVTSNTILSSTSSLFTFFLSLKFLREKFAWIKLCSVLLCMAGTIIVGLSDSEGSSSVAKNHAWGDVLCLVSAGFYGIYTTLIKKKLPDETNTEETASTALFFGYLGLFNGLLVLPFVLILHFTGVEPIYRLTALQYGLLIGKGMLDNVLSDYLWAKAVLLTSTTAATAGLTIQVPIAAVVDSIRGIKLGVLEYIGGICVLLGFFGINEVATGCCTPSIEEDNQNTSSQRSDG